ncbi:MAG: hypothetical protein FWC73_09465 [Defluviitaleaceae bacterium]|nr:hypothetical protein [Defluviitaleaceae bacterium]
MKRVLTVFLLVAALAALFFFVGCSGEEATEPPPPPDVATPEPPPVIAEAGEEAEAEVEAGDPRLVEHGLDENLCFHETVNLSVAIWDRSHERMPDMADNGWTDWIRENVMEQHNINPEFVVVPRWDETPFMTTLIGAGSAPDVSFAFGGMALVNTFAGMGALQDLAPLLAQYNDWLPNMYGFLGANVYWNTDPTSGELFALASRRTEIMRQSTFIREDWLNALDIAPPTSLQEFEDALKAFRDNAELLLGDDANMMIPMMMDGDVGWAFGTIIESMIPDNITEREWFRYDFDVRRIMHPTTKEAIRIANRWFHEGLLFQEFGYGDIGDIIADYVRLGFVGAQIANWDMPYRAGVDQQITTMREHWGPEANFIAVTPFPNDAGNNVMFAFSPADRGIFLPHTNTNQVASLLYIDFMSRQSTRDFLAFGIEGQHHAIEANGAIRLLPSDEQPDNMVFAATNNFDINFVANGFCTGDEELTVNTLALAYAGIDPADIMATRTMALNAARVWRTVHTRPIDAQEGMTTPLNEFRDQIFVNTVIAAPDEFDAIWDTMIAQYMAMGGQAIINERDQAWVEQFGDVDFMPGWEGW